AFDDASAARLGVGRGSQVALDGTCGDGHASTERPEAFTQIDADEPEPTDDENAPLLEGVHGALLRATHQQCWCASDSKRRSDSIANASARSCSMRASSAYSPPDSRRRRKR